VLALMVKDSVVDLCIEADVRVFSHYLRDNLWWVHVDLCAHAWTRIYSSLL